MRQLNALAIFGLIATVGCAEDHDPLSFVVADASIIASGEIGSGSLGRFRDVLEEHPDAKTLILHNIGGSVDDAANVAFARFVRELDFTTRVPSDGLVASGGTDLFLAGSDRVVEGGACVGVHSWAAEDFVATDVPRSHPEHERYLDYYDDMGIDQDFYWFTIDAAPADGMYWMTADELTRFGLVTREVSSLGSEATCDDR